MELLSGVVLFDTGHLIDGTRRFRSNSIKYPDHIQEVLLYPIDHQNLFNFYYIDDVLMISPIQISASKIHDCNYALEGFHLPLGPESRLLIADEENLGFERSTIDEVPSLTVAPLPDASAFKFRFMRAQGGSRHLRVWNEICSGDNPCIITCCSLNKKMISKIDIDTYFNAAAKTPVENPASLPHFSYHPHPDITGAIVPSHESCIVCNQARGYVYEGNTYGADEYDSEICPWCIASGDAADKLDVSFNEVDLIVMHTATSHLSGLNDSRIPYTDSTLDQAVMNELTYKTPGFTGMQEECWMVCCKQPCAYLGTIHPDDADPSCLLDSYPNEKIAFQEVLYPYIQDWIKRTAHDTMHAYLFRCQACHQIGFYTDQG